MDTIKDIGTLPISAAAILWLARTLYLLVKQRNGNAPKTMDDVVRVLETNHEEQKRGFERQESATGDLTRSVVEMNGNIRELIGRIGR